MKKISVYNSSTIKNSIGKLSKEGIKTLLVVDKNHNFLGTLSDGDIRKAILKTKNLNQKISFFYNKNPTFFYSNNLNMNKIRKILINKKFDFIPILNQSRKVIKLIELKDLVVNIKVSKKKSNINIPVVIMAGGLGTRLAPFTSILPKPLIPINNKPVIKHIIDTLFDSGIRNFWITLNYKSVLMKAYFNEMKWKKKINFIEENIPLGTVGAISLIHKKIKSDFFLTNCDTIINADYNEIYKYHKKNKFDLTIVASLRKYEIPYGVCEVDSDLFLKRLNEKPHYDLLVNTGLYVLNKKIIDIIPKNKKYDMNELISLLKKKNSKIGIFPIESNLWIDVGKWSEYKDALKLLS